MSLITLTDPNSSVAEAYRTLRASLMFAANERPIKTLLMAAPDDPSASARAVANLATVFAQIGHRVTAVDANLRAPQLHTLFGIGNERGLIEALAGTGAPSLHSSAVPGLSVLPAGAGTAIASDAVSSKRMTELLADLATGAELVLINAAPTVVSDAAVLAAQCDATLLIVTANKTRRDALAHAKAEMDKARARFLGAVLVG
jgi:capsular exopolysaccharide synthesis family protein